MGIAAAVPRLSPDLRADARAALPAWLASRAVVVVAYVVARISANEVGSQRLPLSAGLLAWDGDWYRAIADVGYDDLPLEAVRYFPLYPLLGRAIGLPFGDRSSIGLVLVANAAALVAAMLLRRLTFELTGDVEAATRATWLLLLSPVSFVLVWSYSEALFLALAIGAMRALHRRAWWWAAVLGGAAALTRPVGVLLAGAAFVGVLRIGRQPDDEPPRRPARDSVPGRLAAVLGPMAGLATYLAWVQARTGEWLAPLEAQTDLRGDFVMPLARITRAVGDVVDGQLAASLHLVAALIFLVLVIVVFARLPLGHGVYAAAVFVVATSADSIASLERYALGAFPVVVVAALLLRNASVERVAIHLCGAALVGLCTVAWLGAYVP